MKNKNFIIAALVLILANIPVSHFYFYSLNKCCDDDDFIPHLFPYAIATLILALIAFIFGFVVSIFIKGHDSYKQRAINNSLLILVFFQSFLFITMLYNVIIFFY